MIEVRAVVVGGSGQIGSWLLTVLAERGHEAIGTYATVAYPGLTQLDSRADGAREWIRTQRADVVFYPAGFTWVDGCEQDPARAYAENAEQPLALATAAVEAGARFVTYSTDYVFDGESGPYSEQAEPRPLNAYGRAKLAAEAAMLKRFGDAVLIARTCWVYGPERQGKNFAYQVGRALSQGKPLLCPLDQYGNPSYGPDVARATVQLVERGVSGLIHVAGPEWMDRVSFARGIAIGLGLDAGLVEGRATEELNQGARRPLRGGLKSERLLTILTGAMRGLRAGMSAFVESVERASEADGFRWAKPGV